METEGLRQVDILNKCKPFCDKFNIKLGRNDISQYISGKVEPKQDKLSILASGLNVDEAWLMGYDVPMNSEEAFLFSQAQEYHEVQMLDVYEILGWDQYHLLEFYEKSSAEGRTELMNFVDYLITKYGIQDAMATKERMHKWKLKKQKEQGFR